MTETRITILIQDKPLLKRHKLKREGGREKRFVLSTKPLSPSYIVR